MRSKHEQTASLSDTGGARLTAALDSSSFCVTNTRNSTRALGKGFGCPVGSKTTSEKHREGPHRQLRRAGQLYSYQSPCSVSVRTDGRASSWRSAQHSYLFLSAATRMRNSSLTVFFFCLRVHLRPLQFAPVYKQGRSLYAAITEAYACTQRRLCVRIPIRVSMYVCTSRHVSPTFIPYFDFIGCRFVFDTLRHGSEL